jgi:plastocyanin
VSSGSTKTSWLVKSRFDFSMKLLLLFLFAVAACINMQAGTIVGVVRAKGKEEASHDVAAGKYDSRKFKFVERVNYSELRDFVVYIDEPATQAPLPPADPVQVVTTKKITQKGAVFSPHVLPVVTGTIVEWPNHDDIFHNVFSISDAKPFDLGLYKHPEVKRITFDKPGRIDVFCSIHSAMNCIILVLPTAHFATADERGRYAITNVPAGTYKLKAWHERLPCQVKEVTVPETGEVQIDFMLGIINLPKY